MQSPESLEHRVMDSPYESINKTLVSKGVSPRYAKRLKLELDDHFHSLAQEFLEQGMSPAVASQQATSQIGDTYSLCEIVANDHAFASYARRFPRLTFLLAPCFSVIAGLALYVLLSLAIIVLVTDCLAWSFSETRLLNLAKTLYIPGAFLLHTAIAIAFCIEARRCACSPRWALIACLAIAIIGGTLRLGFRLPSPTGDEIAVGLSYFTHGLRFVLPLLAFAACIGFRRINKSLETSV